MGLPLLNSSPKYELTIPSTKEKLRFRPFLVKEQKVLLLAAESQDKRQILNAMIDTLKACIDGDSNIYNLAIFDVDYIFTQIRAKSVGENVDLQFSCKECQAANDVVVDLESVEVKIEEKENVIQLTDEISVKMQYPNYKRFMSSAIFDSESATDIIMEVILCSIDSIMTESENIKAADEPRENLMEFIESMTSSQFEKVSSYIQEMPAVHKDIEFNCVKCNAHNELKLQGIDDFF